MLSQELLLIYTSVYKLKWIYPEHVDSFSVGRYMYIFQHIYLSNYKFCVFSSVKDLFQEKMQQNLVDDNKWKFWFGFRISWKQILNGCHIVENFSVSMILETDHLLVPKIFIIKLTKYKLIQMFVCIKSTFYKLNLFQSLGKYADEYSEKLGRAWKYFFLIQHLTYYNIDSK